VEGARAAQGSPGRRRNELRVGRWQGRRKPSLTCCGTASAAAAADLGVGSGDERESRRRIRASAAVANGSRGGGFGRWQRWRTGVARLSSQRRKREENARGVGRLDSTPARRVFGCFLGSYSAKTGPPNGPQVFWSVLECFNRARILHPETGQKPRKNAGTEQGLREFVSV
jgi:hypothetical protein